MPGALRPLLVLGVLALAVALGLQRGLGFAILLLAGAALVLVISFLWQSVQGLDEDEVPLTLEEALGLAAPSAEEERKRAALRALSDLEYERSVGKITEADYTALSQLYRAEARQLLAREDLDDAALRARVEARLAARAAAAGTPADTGDAAEGGGAPPRSGEPASASQAPPASDQAPRDPPSDDSDAGDGSDEDDLEERGSASQPPGPSTSTPRTCGACSTRNDPDARFCKRCGADLEAAA